MIPEIDLAGIIFTSVTELQIWIESILLDGQGEIKFTDTGTKQNILEFIDFSLLINMFRVRIIAWASGIYKIVQASVSTLDIKSEFKSYF